MNGIPGLAETQPVAYAALIIAGVAVLGLAIGHVKIHGIRLGVAGVLFAGILFGHLGLTIPFETLSFVRDFGLILFVYTIGIQVGPGFLTSLRRQGLPLNLLAAGVVLGGALLTIASSRLLHIDMAAAVGIFAGKKGMAKWREHLFVLLSKHSENAADFFQLPPERVYEVSEVVEI